MHEDIFSPMRRHSKNSHSRQLKNGIVRNQEKDERNKWTGLIFNIKV